MILVTRLNSQAFALNPDLIERAERTPDTVITLVDGTKYIVTESLDECIQLIRDYRASVIAAAQHQITLADDGRRHGPTSRRVGSGTKVASGAKVVQLNPREH